MSDAVILGLVTSISATVGIIVTVWGNIRVLTIKRDVDTVKKEVGIVKEEVVTVKANVAVVHDNVNSKTDKQMKMIKALAKAEQKVEDAINGKHKIIPEKKTVPKKK